MFKLPIKLRHPFRPHLPARPSSFLRKCFPGVPHHPKDPPLNYNPTELNTDCFSAPDNVQLLVFRPMKKGEVLGPKASKHKDYKNPEYYTYHRYSFVDLQKNALRIRLENRIKETCPKLIAKTEGEKCEREAKECEQDDGSEETKDSNCEEK